MEITPRLSIRQLKELLEKSNKLHAEMNPDPEELVRIFEQIKVNSSGLGKGFLLGAEKIVTEKAVENKV